MFEVFSVASYEHVYIFTYFQTHLKHFHHIQHVFTI